ncbi:MAG: hypothetical protein J3K34DRAFT_417984 [Monoraphidium minutum]|nr:MAG: hypothetical protein J3K34DRAFT_417984 [Monoraphidium minutum]
MPSGQASANCDIGEARCVGRRPACCRRARQQGLPAGWPLPGRSSARQVRAAGASAHTTGGRPTRRSGADAFPQLQEGERVPVTRGRHDPDHTQGALGLGRACDRARRAEDVTPGLCAPIRDQHFEPVAGCVGGVAAGRDTLLCLRACVCVCVPHSVCVCVCTRVCAHALCACVQARATKQDSPEGGHVAAGH